MKPKSDDKREAQTTPNGAAHLKAALGRFLKRARHGLRPDAVAHVPVLDRPTDEWSHSIERRLTEVERKLSSQNRLLILTAASIFLDLIYGMAR